MPAHKAPGNAKSQMLISLLHKLGASPLLSKFKVSSYRILSPVWLAQVVPHVPTGTPAQFFRLAY
jgi:hypothetical protein